MSGARAAGAAVAVAVASGALLWLASPAVGAGWLAWVALVPVAVLVLRRPGTASARLAVPLAFVVYMELLLVPSLPFGIAKGQWGEPPLPVMVGDSPVLAVAFVAVPLAGLLLWLVRFGQPWIQRGSLALVLVPALAWTALDVVRSKADPGGFWGPLFVSQNGVALGDLASLGGPWLLTFAVVAVNYAIALAVVRGRRGLAGPVVVVTVVAGLAVAASAGADGDARPLTVAAVQPGYDTAEDGRPELRWFERGTYDLAALDTVRDLGELTLQAAARGAELVVWPEAAIWVDPRSDRLAAPALRRLAAEAGVFLLVPFFLNDRDQGATVLLSPDGAFSATQPKQRPMWFLGEDGGNRRSPRPVAAPGGLLGTLLGVDDQDAASGRRLAARGATVLASSTHDWQQLVPHHRAHARLLVRAAGAPLVRADWRYGSVIYDRDGRVVASAGDATRRTVLVADVTPADGRTAYARLGDVFAWLAVAATAALGLLAGVRHRRSRYW